MKKNNLKELYLTNKEEYLEKPPQNPKPFTHYILPQNFHFNPFKYFSLSLSQSSTHRHPLIVHNKKFQVRSRKCIACMDMQSMLLCISKILKETYVSKSWSDDT